MKAISLWQPWASLWLTDRKVHETRHWATNYRGQLLVHAAKRQLSRAEYRALTPRLRDICSDEFGGHWAMDLPYGALIGTVYLAHCYHTQALYSDRLYADEPLSEQRPDDYYCGDFTPDRWAWKRTSYRAFDRPIPYKGRQGFFDVPDSTLLALEAA